MAGFGQGLRHSGPAVLMFFRERQAAPYAIGKGRFGGCC
jgi:hypothetical protein